MLNKKTKPHIAIFIKSAQETGEPDFIGKIADETVATTIDQLLPFLEKVNHPALAMPSLI